MCTINTDHVNIYVHTHTHTHAHIQYTTSDIKNYLEGFLNNVSSD